MQTTIKQQIKVVQKVYNQKQKTVAIAESNHPHSRMCKAIVTVRKDIVALNDAASTLAAVGMMEKQINHLPALIKACENITKFYHKENTWPVQELNNILNKLKS